MTVLTPAWTLGALLPLGVWSVPTGVLYVITLRFQSAHLLCIFGPTRARGHTNAIFVSLDSHRRGLWFATFAVMRASGLSSVAYAHENLVKSQICVFTCVPILVNNFMHNLWHWKLQCEKHPFASSLTGEKHFLCIVYVCVLWSLCTGRNQWKSLPTGAKHCHGMFLERTNNERTTWNEQINLC